MKPARTCAFPTLKHQGRPVRATNYEIKGNMILQKCPETGRYFEVKVALRRYPCCKDIIWVEKDYLPGGEILDLTGIRHES